MLHLRDIKARLPRLCQRIDEFAQEIQLLRTAETPLLPLELQKYLEGLYDALAGLDAGRVVLEKTAERIEALNLPEGLG